MSFCGQCGRTQDSSRVADAQAVPINTSGTFDAGTPKPLFDLRAGRINNRHPYAVTADGQRVLVNALVGELGSQSAIKIVLNWNALLRK